MYGCSTYRILVCLLLWKYHIFTRKYFSALRRCCRCEHRGGSGGCLFDSNSQHLDTFPGEARARCLSRSAGDGPGVFPFNAACAGLCLLATCSSAVPDTSSVVSAMTRCPSLDARRTACTRGSGAVPLLPRLRVFSY